MRTVKKLGLAGSLMFAATSFMWGFQPHHQQTGTPTQTEQGSKVSVPNRPPSPLFKGEQGTQQSQISFTPPLPKEPLKPPWKIPTDYSLQICHRPTSFFSTPAFHTTTYSQNSNPPTSPL